jgi:hypothetical protein
MTLLEAVLNGEFKQCALYVAWFKRRQHLQYVSSNEGL